jgi:hypothetical protein
MNEDVFEAMKAHLGLIMRELETIKQDAINKRNTLKQKVISR